MSSTTASGAADWPDLFDEPITNDRGVKVAEWTYQAPDGSPWETVERWQTPQGKRFVASFGSVSGQGGPTGFTTADIAVAGEFSLDLVGEHFRVADDAQGFTAGGPMTFYAGPGDTIEGLAQRGGISRDVVFEFMLVGHLEDLPS